MSVDFFFPCSETLCFLSLTYLFLREAPEPVGDVQSSAKCLIYPKQNNSSVFADIYFSTSDPWAHKIPETL